MNSPLDLAELNVMLPQKSAAISQLCERGLHCFYVDVIMRPCGIRELG
jgi:hypothetical protein